MTTPRFARRHLRHHRFAPLALAALSSLPAGCSETIRRYPLAPPLWVDRDTNHVPKTPSEYYSGLLADGMDKMALRPLSELFHFPLPGESVNVNAIDEVPNSSWFQNRIGLFAMTPGEVARGACNGPPLDPKRGPWEIVAAKPNGANPGFFIKTPQGRYLLKFDSPQQPQRATAADVIGSKIYHAAGYHTPCNEIVYFRKSVLKIGKSTKARDKYGDKYPFGEKDLIQLLKMAYRRKDGIMRASASKFVDGKPIGPWTYEGRRSDDPNDVIDHEDRREIRANRLLAAWLNHTDTREQNTLDVWTKLAGRAFIKHYYIDWGDCLGGRWPTDPMSRRLGHSYYFDARDIGVDFISLGLVPRPWHNTELNREAEIFAYFTAKHFNPSQWKGGYANPAFERMTARDAMWMVRIISRFTDDHIRALVKTGRLDYERASRYLVRALIRRRDKLLRYYLSRYSPLDRFRLVRRRPGDKTQSLCFEDLAIKHRVVKQRDVLYKMRFYGGRHLKNELGWLQFRPDPDHPQRSCVVFPVGDRRPAELAPRGAPDNHPDRYGVLKIYNFQQASVRPNAEIWVFFYDLGPDKGYRLVAIDRRPHPVLPDLF